MLIADGFVKAQHQYRAEKLKESFSKRGTIRLLRRWLIPERRRRPSLEQRKAW